MDLLIGGEKVSWVRALLKERLSSEASPSGGYRPAMVDRLTALQVAGMPEFTLVTIIENYAALMRGSIPPHEAFARIEQHRSSGTGIPVLTAPSSLALYVMERVLLEHSHGAPIHPYWIWDLTNRCYDRFGLPREPLPTGYPVDSLFLSKLTLAERHAHLVAICRDCWNRDIAFEDWVEMVEPHVDA